MESLIENRRTELSTPRRCDGEPSGFATRILLGNGDNRPMRARPVSAGPAELGFDNGIALGTAELSTDPFSIRNVDARRDPPNDRERPTDHDPVGEAMRTGTQFQAFVALRRPSGRWLRSALAALVATKK